jgi:hypothetical protein
VLTIPLAGRGKTRFRLSKSKDTFTYRALWGTAPAWRACSAFYGLRGSRRSKGLSPLITGPSPGHPGLATAAAQRAGRAWPRTPGSRRGKSGSTAWTDDGAVALGDPYDSLRIVSVTSCLGRPWQQRRRRRSRASEPDLPPSPITPLTGRRGQARPARCDGATPSRPSNERRTAAAARTPNTNPEHEPGTRTSNTNLEHEPGIEHVEV